MSSLITKDEYEEKIPFSKIFLINKPLSLGNIYFIFSLTTPINVSLLTYIGSLKISFNGWNNLI